MSNIAEQFAQFFQGRTDIAGVFTPSTGETHADRNQPVTLATYQAHLDGRRSLGIYPLTDDNTVRWFAFDDHRLVTRRRLRVRLSRA